jgi:hypothetical protein
LASASSEIQLKAEESQVMFTGGEIKKMYSDFRIAFSLRKNLPDKRNNINNTEFVNNKESYESMNKSNLDKNASLQPICWFGF